MDHCSPLTESEREEPLTHSHSGNIVSHQDVVIAMKGAFMIWQALTVSKARAMLLTVLESLMDS